MTMEGSITRVTRAKLPHARTRGRPAGVRWEGPHTARIALVCVLASAACTADDVPGNRARFSRFDSAGIEVVENVRPAWTEATRWRVEPDPAWVIRTPDEDPDPAFTLFRVNDIVRLSDGRLVVENQGTDELLVFDASGAHIATWGGTGDGPGEFRRMERLFLCPGDTLLVQEYHRATRLDSSGLTADVVPRRNELVQGLDRSTGMGIVYHGVTANCEAALWGWYPKPVMRESPRGTLWQRHKLVWVPYDGRTVDTFGDDFVRNELMRETEFELPFALTPDWATDGVSVFYGLGDIPEIEVLGRDGEVHRLIRWPASPRAITPADWEEYDRGFDWLVSENPSWPEERRIRADQLPYNSMPVFALGYYGHGDLVPGVRVDADGHLWVRQYEPASLRHRISRFRGIASQRWWVFDPGGRWLGEIRTPENLSIRWIGDGWIVGVSRDDFHVEDIRAYRITSG